MDASFGEGALNPYQVIMSLPPGAATVLTAAYFATEGAVIQRLLAAQPRFMLPRSVAALSFFSGRNVSLQEATAYLNPGSTLYSSAAAQRYRAAVGGLVTADRSTTIVQISVIVSPTPGIDADFVTGVRDELARLTAEPVVPGLAVQMVLRGGYCLIHDTQQALYALVPLEVGVVVAIVVIVVGGSFGSVAVALRLILTIAVSLCWTYGWTVLVYQPGKAKVRLSCLSCHVALLRLAF
jgi:hypothetical protein